VVRSFLNDGCLREGERSFVFPNSEIPLLKIEMFADILNNINYGTN